MVLLECSRFALLLLWNNVQSFLTVAYIKICFLILEKNKKQQQQQQQQQKPNTCFIYGKGDRQTAYK